MIFYAPNVHVGGGFELLKSLVKSFEEADDIYYILDYRISDLPLFNSLSNIYFVKPDPISRFKAELFAADLAQKHSKIFCFHGLPPLFYKGNNIIVFLQNRLYINGFSVAGYKTKTALRLTFERCLFYFYRHKICELVVQSNSMKSQAESLFTKFSNTKISVKPFIEISSENIIDESVIKEYDFIYVADGSAHKNHQALFEAWRLLALKGYFPSLIVTLDETSTDYLQLIKKLNEVFGCKIINIGFVSKEIVSLFYKKSSALIYPSLVESFGMPLIEAKQYGLPILAAELDYVRDVVEPDETFNPLSSVSISLSVLRFIGDPAPVIKLESPYEFKQYLVLDVLEKNCV